MRELTPSDLADRVEWNEPEARLAIMERRAREAMADPRWRPYRSPRMPLFASITTVQSLAPIDESAQASE